MDDRKTMRRWLELHDSSIDAVESHSGSLVLRLEAYVHQWEPVSGGWRGTGWSQPVIVRLQNAAPLAPFDLPVRIADGSLLSGTERLDNGMPLPFCSSGAVRLVLDLATGDHLDLTATAAELVESGEARFIEDLPADLRPFE